MSLQDKISGTKKPCSILGLPGVLWVNTTPVVCPYICFVTWCQESEQMSHIYEIPYWNSSREIVQKAPTFVHSRVTTDEFCRTSTSLGRFGWSPVWKISTYIEREAASFVGNWSSGDVLCLRAYIKLSLHSSRPIKKGSTEHVRIHTELHWISQVSQNQAQWNPYFI